MGTPALARGLQKQSVEIAALLKRFDVFQLSSEDGRTPLSYAAQSGHSAVVNVLLMFQHILPDLADEPGTSMNTLLDDLRNKAQGGRTPLSYAAQGGHVDVIKLLLRSRVWTLKLETPHWTHHYHMRLKESSSCLCHVDS
ncbi:hypothetical protein C8J57DRAFT_1528907 [Mycena rebaudengoi]|nr:hypothetical protein C8J57DRAFT_1528907 [Mycena rebaudengoi]